MVKSSGSTDNPTGTFKVPADIESFTKEKKIDVAREMCQKTKYSNQKIAELCFLTAGSVATTRLHQLGKLKDPPHSKQARQGDPLKGAKAVASSLPGEVPPVDPSMTLPESKAKEVKPTTTEARIAHAESGINDLGSKFNGLESSINKKFDDLARLITNGRRAEYTEQPPRANVPAAAPKMVEMDRGIGDDGDGLGTGPNDGNNGGVEQESVRAGFEEIVEKVPISVDRRTLFAAWKAKNNRDAKRGIGKEFNGSIADFLILIAFDSFFGERHGGLMYVESAITTR